jgi:CopA family copper-resistance protein
MVLVVFAGIVLNQSYAMAGDYFIDIAEHTLNLTGDDQTAILANGILPGSTLHWQEGETVTVHVTNHLSESSSIHWHGILLPYQMDGVPGISFSGIAAGETFTYRFQVKQSGTYWYHGHSGMQEQSGLYGALIITPENASRPEKNDYIILLSDWPEADPYRTMTRLKKQSDYYNYQKRTIVDFFNDIKNNGFMPTLNNRMDWARIRMEPTDLADVTGATYHFLVNGLTPQQNWTAVFNPDRKVRLRFINASAMTHFDIRIPGLKLRVVESDGVAVQPVEVDEFRIAVAETYDVIVEPNADRAYTIFAEAMDRSGFARATLTPNKLMTAEVPSLRPITLLTMADMGEMHAHGNHIPQIQPMEHKQPTHHHPSTHAVDAKSSEDNKPIESQINHQSSNHHSHHLTHQDMIEKPAASYPILKYQHLKASKPANPLETPDRKITLRLTGNMNRYVWSFNDVKYSDAEPIRVRYGEHIRFKYVNETMMNHPIHLHGMWQYLDTGKDDLTPRNM